MGTRVVGSELFRNSKVVRFTNALVGLTSNSAVEERFSLRGQHLRLFFFSGTTEKKGNPGISLHGLRARHVAMSRLCL